MTSTLYSMPFVNTLSRVQKLFMCSEKGKAHLQIAVRHVCHGEIPNQILFITGYTFHDFDMTEELFLDWQLRTIQYTIPAWEVTGQLI